MKKITSYVAGLRPVGDVDAGGDAPRHHGAHVGEEPLRLFHLCFVLCGVVSQSGCCVLWA